MLYKNRRADISHQADHTIYRSLCWGFQGIPITPHIGIKFAYILRNVCVESSLYCVPFCVQCPSVKPLLKFYISEFACDLFPNIKFILFCRRKLRQNLRRHLKLFRIFCVKFACSFAWSIWGFAYFLHNICVKCPLFCVKFAYFLFGFQGLFCVKFAFRKVFVAFFTQTQKGLKKTFLCVCVAIIPGNLRVYGFYIVFPLFLVNLFIYYIDTDCVMI